MDNIDRSKIEKYKKRTKRDDRIDKASSYLKIGLSAAAAITFFTAAISLSTYVPFLASAFLLSALVVHFSSSRYRDTVASKNCSKLRREESNVREQERELEQKPSLPTPLKSDALTPPANHARKLKESRNISADEQALLKER